MWSFYHHSYETWHFLCSHQCPLNFGLTLCKVFLLASTSFPLFLYAVSCTRWHGDKTNHNCVSWSYSEHCWGVYQSNPALLPCQKNHWEEWQGMSEADSDCNSQGCVCQHITGHRASKPGRAAHLQKKRRHAKLCSHLCFLLYICSFCKEIWPLEKLVAQHSH